MQSDDSLLICTLCNLDNCENDVCLEEDINEQDDISFCIRLMSNIITYKVVKFSYH